MSDVLNNSTSKENLQETPNKAATPFRNLASSAKKKIMSFVTQSEREVWHPVSRPSNVQRQCFLSEDLEWSGNAFTLGKQIGSGSFATVFLGTHNFTGQTFAIKKVPLPSGQHYKRQKESLEREISVLRDCRSPYIVSYFGSFVDPEGSNMCIVMEFLAGGTLQDVVKEYDQYGGLDETSMHGVLNSVLQGLAYLHERNIMHRDLKSKNILIDLDGSTKLADFGVSRELNQSGMARSMVGTPLFMAPEVLEGEAYTAVADIWGLGIVALHVANGEIPRRGTPVRELMRMVIAQPAPKVNKPAEWSGEFNEFVSMCLQKDPGRRADCKQLLECAWIKNFQEDAQATRVDMKNRTVGRASMFNEPKTPRRSTVIPNQQQTPVAAAAPAPAPAAVVAPPAPAVASLQAPANKQSTSMLTVNQTAAKLAPPTKEQVTAYEQQPMDDVVKELLGWKQLALKLLDERDKVKAESK